MSRLDHAVVVCPIVPRPNWEAKSESVLDGGGGGGRTRTAFGTEEEEKGTYGIVCVFLSGRLCLRLIKRRTHGLRIKGDVVVKLKCGRRRRRGTMESEMIYARKIEEGEIDENLGRSLASLSIMCRGNE